MLLLASLLINSITGAVAAHGASGGIAQQAAVRNGFQKSTAHVNTAATQAGLDSLGAVEFRNAVSGAFAMDVPATAAFDYPTVAALAAYISSKAILRIYFS